MANYVRFYLQRGSFDGKQLLQPASIERMETPETLPSAKLGRMAGYGLYNYESTEGAFVFHGHHGGVGGALTEMAYLPDYGRGYAFMINSESGRALSRISELVRHYITRGLKPPALPPVAVVPADLQRHYAGYYQYISPRVQMTYGLARLFEIGWLGFTTNRVSVIGLSRAQMVPVTDRLLRQKDQSIATLALLPDSDGETLIQFGTETFKKVSGWRVWGQFFCIVVVFLVMLGTPVAVLVWWIRKLLGKLHNAGPFSLRLMPFLSAVFFGTFWALLIFSGGNILALGAFDALTVGIMLSSTAFALTAAASLYLVARHWGITHESLYLVASVRGGRCYFGCRGLYGLLGYDWDATLDVLADRRWKMED